MRLLAVPLILALAAAPAFAAIPAFAAAPPSAAGKPRPTGFAAPRPIYKLTLGRGQNTAIAQPKKIVKAVSGAPAIVEVARFGRATPTIGLMAHAPGVTNVLVWTSDAQVHTYRVTVK